MPAIDGLSSGLDTTSIINQLMQLERIPQQRLQSKQSATEAAILSLRTLNSKYLALSSITAKFGAALPGSVAATTTDWQLTTASSSDATRVSASAVTGAPASSLSFNVKQLATAASYLGNTTYTGTAAPFAQDAAGATHTSLTLTKGTGAPVTIDTGTGSLADTVAAINKAGAGVSASTVQIAPGEYRLQLTSTTTGTGAITLTDPDGVEHQGTNVVPGQDAVIVLAGGTEVTRSSNTISDVLEGVTLTLTKADWDGTTFTQPPVTVSVSSDAEGVAARVQELVDAVNAARQEGLTLTHFDPVSKIKGKLYGDSSVRALADRVRAAVNFGTDGPALAGVTVARDGKVEFDKEKFLTALAADPAAVEAALGKDGMAGRLHTLADEVSRSASAVGGPGLITSAITSRESQIVTLKSNIENWDSRLALKRTSLQRQYAALETALGKAQSQGQWLAGQLAGLPKWES